MTSRTLSVRLALLTLFLLAGGATAADLENWPCWRGADRSGRSPSTGLLTDWDVQAPKLLWTAEGMGRGYAGVSVADGKIYTTGNLDAGQSVIAVDATTGQPVWSVPLLDNSPKHGYQGSRCTPAVDGDRLYVISSDGAIHCLSTRDGELIWKKDFRAEWNGRMMSGWGFSESPLVDGDRVICTPGGPEAMMVALNKLTGDEIWRCEVPKFGDKGKMSAAYSSVVISEGAGVKQYVQVIGAGAIGVRAEDGKFLWGYDGIVNRTAMIPTPVVYKDYVFCSTGYGDGGAALLELSAESDGVKATEKYYHPSQVMQNHHGGMILVDGYVYFGHGHNNGFPMCVNLETGEIAWGGRFRGAGSGSAALAYADGHLVFRYQSGEVALIEATPEEYKLKGTFKPAYQEDRSWAHPVIIGGRMYLREQDKLMCYDVQASS